MNGDTVIYFHRDHTSYVGLVGDRWLKWPARHNGWLGRVAVSESEAEGAEEIAEPKLTRLALVLSGWEDHG